MVLTVEPGIYIARDYDKVGAEWRGIGVRIEDDVAITASGNEVLTAACPKEISIDFIAYMNRDYVKAKMKNRKLIGQKFP